MALSGIAQTIDGARSILANCSAWQTWTGSVDASQAKMATFPIAAPDDARYPYALINFGEFVYDRIAEHGYRFSGGILIFIEDEVDENDSIAWAGTEFPTDNEGNPMNWASNAWTAVLLHFVSKIGDIETQLRALSGTGSYQVYQQVRVSEIMRVNQIESAGGRADLIWGVIQCDLGI